MTTWKYYPKSNSPPESILKIIEVFEEKNESIKSSEYRLSSNQVLSIVRNDLLKNGFIVEKSKKAEDKIRMSICFGENSEFEQCFNVDAFHKETGTVLEVEAGRAVDNYQFLKDLFESCLMQGVEFLAIAVRNTYRNQNDFDSVKKHFDSLYSSDRLKLPLKGVLIIGY